MTKAQKLEFINDLTNGIRDRLFEDVTSGRIPENWDGKQLRMLIAERLHDVCWYKPTRNERRDFNNDCAINSL